MPLPDIHDIYRPVLEALRDEAPHNLSINDLMNIASEYFAIGELSKIDRNLFKKRITLAKNELMQKKFLTNPSDNMYIITSAGLNYLNAPEKAPEEVHEEVSETEVPEIIQEVSEDEISEEPDEPDEIPEVIEAEPEPEDIAEPEREPEEIPEEVHDEIMHEAQDDDIILDDEPQPDEPDEPDEVPAEIMSEAQDDDIILEDEPQPEHEHEHEPEHETQEPEPETESNEGNESIAMNENQNENQSIGIEDAIRIHNEELAEKVLSGMSALPEEMFEVFVIDMLSKMGYRAFHNARYTSEESGSNLIHGVIIDDKTGAPIYIHARKSSPNKTIGRADMQDFIDALSDKGGKGVFATTAKFSEQAEVLANDERIMLIDGLKLAGLMVAHNFCVKVQKVYEIKEFDTESFSEYQK